MVRLGLPVPTSTAPPRTLPTSTVPLPCVSPAAPWICFTGYKLSSWAKLHTAGSDVAKLGLEIPHRLVMGARVEHAVHGAGTVT